MALDQDSSESLRFRHVVATHLIRPMRGSSRSVLAIADDDHLYIVKFANNPGGPNVLANEVLGSLLCEALNLPVAVGAFVHVHQHLLDGADSFWAQASNSRFQPHAGIHFGSRYVGSRDGTAQLYDILPKARHPRITNRSDFLGMLVLDIWANHQDHRQSVFNVSNVGRNSTATFIDHGDMFGGPMNIFDDTCCKALYFDPTMYRGLCDFRMIEAWKDKLYEAAPAVLLEPLDYVPLNWFDGNHRFVRMMLATRLAELDRLIEPFATIIKLIQT